MSETTPQPPTDEQETPAEEVPVAEAEETAAPEGQEAEPTLEDALAHAAELPPADEPAEDVPTAEVEPGAAAASREAPELPADFVPPVEPAVVESAVVEPAVAASAPAAAAGPAAEPEPATFYYSSSAPSQPVPVQPVPVQPAPEPVAQPGPFYTPAPVPPQPKGNRGAGFLIVLLGVVVYAVLDAAAVLGTLDWQYGADQSQSSFESYLQSWSFWLPLVVFAAAFVALVAIVNRAGWWAYVLGSAFVAALVYAGFLAAVLVTLHAWNYSYEQAVDLLHRFLTTETPYVLVSWISTFVALEVVVWLGLWIARRGAAVRRRNFEARMAFDAQLGAFPPPGV